MVLKLSKDFQKHFKRHAKSSQQLQCQTQPWPIIIFKVLAPAQSLSLPTVLRNLSLAQRHSPATALAAPLNFKAAQSEVPQSSIQPKRAIFLISGLPLVYQLVKDNRMRWIAFSSWSNICLVFNLTGKTDLSTIVVGISQLSTPQIDPQHPIHELKEKIPWVYHKDNEAFSKIWQTSFLLTLVISMQLNLRNRQTSFSSLYFGLELQISSKIAQSQYPL